ncbi:MAG: hypothetical protein JXR88_02505 [Clostridia bacterium]|nr:hypothetical protein [Clostridia bacterium]
MESKVYKSRIDGVATLLEILGKIAMVGYTATGIYNFFKLSEFGDLIDALMSSGLILINGLALGGFLMAVGHGLQYLKDLRDITLEQHTKK